MGGYQLVALCNEAILFRSLQRLDFFIYLNPEFPLFSLFVVSDTSLKDAAARGQVDLIKELVAQGTHLNTPDRLGETALHCAAANNQSVVIRILVAANAQIDAADKNGNAPIHRAAENGHTRAMSAFFDLGANIHQKNRDGDTPLHLAARNNHGDLVHDLLTFGANLKTKNLNYKNAKDVAKAASTSAALQAMHQYKVEQSIASKIKAFFS